MKNISKKIQCIGECLFIKYLKILIFDPFLLLIKIKKVKFVDFPIFQANFEAQCASPHKDREGRNIIFLNKKGEIQNII